MRVETLLPLGKVDPGLRQSDMPLDIHSVYTAARLIEGNRTPRAQTTEPKVAETSAAREKALGCC
jgi:hypothetical protein